MPSYPIIGDFPKIGDFRFTQVSQWDTLYSDVSGFYQFDQRPFADSSMFWQTPKSYLAKKAFIDKNTVIVNTAQIGAAPTTWPELILVGPSSSFPIFDYVYGNGAIRTNMTYTDPNTGVSYPMDSYQWQFYFNDIITEAGCYYLEMTIYGDEAKTVSQKFLSEPILISETHLGCVLIESKYNTNRVKERVIVAGWADGLVPTFQHRVEGMPLLYNPKANYISYLQQNYLNTQLNVDSWRTFKFKLGEISTGVPSYLVEKVSKSFEADEFKIDGKPFILDIDNSTGLQSLWDSLDPEASNLTWSSAPIREKYLNEQVYFSITPTEAIEIFEADAYPFAVTPFKLNTGDRVISADCWVADDNGEYNDYIAYLNGLGAGGIFSRVGQTTIYTPVSGLTPSLIGVVEVFYDFFTIAYAGTGTGLRNGYAFAGVGAKQVIDWGDGTAFEYQSSVTGATIPVPHTFTVALSPTSARVFHNNAIGTLRWFDNGSIYPVSGIFLSGITDTLPSGLGTFDVRYCPQFGVAFGGALMIDFATIPNVIFFRVAECAGLTNISSVMTEPLDNIFNFFVFFNPLNSTEVDAIFNAFTATVWNGTTAGGTIDTKCAPTQPPAAPTAASSAARAALNIASWTVTTD